MLSVLQSKYLNRRDPRSIRRSFQVIIGLGFEHRGAAESMSAYCTSSIGDRFANVWTMAFCAMLPTASRSNVAMPTLARITTQSVPKACPRTTSSRFASGTRLCTTKSLARCRPQKRQVRNVTLSVHQLELAGLVQ